MTNELALKQTKTRAEPFITMLEAADELGLPYFKIRRAVKAGIIPSYTLLNRRSLLRLSEVIGAIEASAQGGENV